MAHVRALPWAGEVVVGVTSAAELDEIWQAWQVPAALAAAGLATDELSLLDPRTWAEALRRDL